MVDIYTDYYHNKTVKIMDEKVAHDCMKECKSFIDCFTETFEVKTVRINYFSEKCYLNIGAPSHPDQVIQHSAKIIFEEFVSFIASLIGLYFGVSVIMLSEVCLKSTRILTKNFCTHFDIKSKY